MEILFSGLDEYSFTTWWGDADLTGQQISLLPSSKFIDSLKQPSAEQKAARWVWLYCAPWDWFNRSEFCEIGVALEQWLSQQLTILDLCRRTDVNLTIINIDSTVSRSLNPDYTQEKNSIAGESKDSKANLISGLFESFAPSYWDTFEALEGISWLPHGEAIFRTSSSGISERGLIQLLTEVQSAQQMPLVKGKLDEAMIKIADLEKQLIVEKNSTIKATIELAASRAKPEFKKIELEQDLALLKAQLHQAQHELQTYYYSAKNYGDLLDSSHDTLQRANETLKQFLPNT